jgi:hypothetical protein
LIAIIGVSGCFAISVSLRHCAAGRVPRGSRIEVKDAQHAARNTAVRSECCPVPFAALAAMAVAHGLWRGKQQVTDRCAQAASLVCLFHWRFRAGGKRQRNRLGLISRPLQACTPASASARYRLRACKNIFLRQCIQKGSRWVVLIRQSVIA